MASFPTQTNVIRFTSAENCLKMCGLEAFGDAMVGSLGVEHRKRTTIGVELAAKVCFRTVYQDV